MQIVGIDTNVIQVADKLVRIIDPDFEAHKAERWKARPADLLTAIEERRIGRFFIRNELFEDVKEHMATELERTVSNEEAEGFLARNPVLLGSIVGYDGVETEERYQIWEECRHDENLVG